MNGGDPEDVVTGAGRRLRSDTFTSGLSVNDFASCLQLGLRPVGFVQGFCVMQWSFYGANSPYMRTGSPYGGAAAGQYYENWNCPHGWVSSEHRSWGQNYEQPWVQATWRQGFGAAYTRMVEESVEAGADGIIGVVDTSRHLGDMGVTEFHITGTAVVIEPDGPAAAVWGNGAGAPAGSDGSPWTTYLAGPRLAKLLEAGWRPVSVAATMTSIRVWAYCITEYLLRGQGGGFGGFGTVGLGGRPGGVLGGVLGGAVGGALGGGANRVPGAFGGGFGGFAGANRGGFAGGAGGGAGGGGQGGIYPATSGGGEEIAQLSSAHAAARQRARDHITAQLAGDDLHGVQLEVRQRSVGEGDEEISCVMKGTRVHRFRDYEALPPPRPTVRLS